MYGVGADYSFPRLEHSITPMRKLSAVSWSWFVLFLGFLVKVPGSHASGRSFETLLDSYERVGVNAL